MEIIKYQAELLNPHLPKLLINQSSVAAPGAVLHSALFLWAFTLRRENALLFCKSPWLREAITVYLGPPHCRFKPFKIENHLSEMDAFDTAMKPPI